MDTHGKNNDVKSHVININELHDNQRTFGE